MYYTLERRISLCLYAIFLLTAVVLLLRSKISSKKILGVYTLVLTVMGFIFLPHVNADINRLNEMMVNYAQSSIEEFVSVYLASSATPAADLLMYVIGKTGVLGLLPALAAFITYSCSYYILERSAERYKISRKNVAVALFFFMSTGNYIFVITGIRTAISVALICFCFFRETAEKTFHVFHLLLYAVAALMHNFGVILICLRIAAILLDSRISRRRRLGLILTAGVAAVAALIIYPSLFRAVLERALLYITGDVYSNKNEYIIAAVVFCLLIWILHSCGKLSERYRTETACIRGYLGLCLLTAICFCFEYTIFQRLTTYIAPTLALPLMLIVLEEKDRGRMGGRRLAKTERTIQFERIVTPQRIIVVVSAALLIFASNKAGFGGLRLFTFG